MGSECRRCCRNEIDALEMLFEISIAWALQADYSEQPSAVPPLWSGFPDFGPDPDFFEEIGPEMVRIYAKKSGFD